MTLFFFIVALLNLGLGYALAIYLHKAPAGDDHAAWQPDVHAPHGDAGWPMANPSLADPMTADNAARYEDLSPITTAVTQSPTAASPTTATAAHLDEQLDEAEKDIDHHRAEVMRVDSHLRRHVENPAVDDVLACHRDLKTANDLFLEKFGAVRPHTADEAPASVSLFQQFDAANSKHATRVRGSGERLDALDVTTNLAASCQALIDEAALLVSDDFAARDALSEVRLGLAQINNYQGDDDGDDVSDRIGTRRRLDATLAARWHSDPPGAKPFYVALLDIDNFTPVNQLHGAAVGDRLLEMVEQTLLECKHPADRVLRFSGQRYAILFPDDDATAATTMVERVRQSVASAKFHCGMLEIALTMTCAVVVTLPEDTHQSLWTRAELTLQERRRNGRNQTFYHDGTQPVPVPAAQLDIEPRVLALT